MLSWRRWRNGAFVFELAGICEGFETFLMTLLVFGLLQRSDVDPIDGDESRILCPSLWL